MLGLIYLKDCNIEEQIVCAYFFLLNIALRIIVINKTYNNIEVTEEHGLRVSSREKSKINVSLHA